MKNLSLIFILLATVGLSKAQPVNDDPCGAIPLAVDTVCNLVATNSYGATNTAGIPAPDCTPVVKDVWFSMTVPASGMFTVETAAGTIVDGILAVYTGSCDSITYAYCDDDSGDGLMPLLDMQGFIPGSTVYIRFSRKGGGAGTFSICAWDNNPPLGTNSDCTTAQQLCTEESFTANNIGNGEVDDLNATNKGCLTPNEHQSSWYYFTFGSPGEFSFTITPLNPDDNYNFAIWGPDLPCPMNTDPLRCSYSNETGETGIETTSVDLSEGVAGDGWVKFINVFAGETYFLMIDNYSESGEGFTFDFEGPPTIDCLPYMLPVTLTYFDGYNDGATNVLNWITESELNNAMFIVERSGNGNGFYEIGRVDGAGTTSESNNYTFVDDDPINGISYYRLKQVDYNGDVDYSEIIDIANSTTNTFTVSPNPSSGIIYINHREAPGTTYSIEVINATGGKQLSLVETAENEFITDKITIPEQGIYWIILRNGENATASKIIIH